LLLAKGTPFPLAAPLISLPRPLATTDLLISVDLAILHSSPKCNQVTCGLWQLALLGCLSLKEFEVFVSVSR
jgi:hypothetical protein